MNIHCFQHVAFEGLASIGNWANKNDHKVSYTRFYNNEKLPDIKNVDFLIIMGGPMSFNDDEKYPWLADEKNFVKKAIENGKTVLGICLGAQIIADVLDGSARRGHSKEIGWFDLKFNLHDAPFNFLPSSICVFHWHGDTFEIPKGAKRIASTVEYPNQAFLFKNNVMGLQFHLEMTPVSVEGMVNNCKNELVYNTYKYVQTAEEIINGVENCKKNVPVMFNILHYLEKNTNI